MACFVLNQHSVVHAVWLNIQLAQRRRPAHQNYAQQIHSSETCFGTALDSLSCEKKEAQKLDAV